MVGNAGERSGERGVGNAGERSGEKVNVMKEKEREGRNRVRMERMHFKK